MTPITTTQYRVDAVPFASELDVSVAVMEYCGEVENLPAAAFQTRSYTNEGLFVLIDIGNGCFRWLTRGTR